MILRSLSQARVDIDHMPAANFLDVAVRRESAKEAPAQGCAATAAAAAAAEAAGA